MTDGTDTETVSLPFTPLERAVYVPSPDADALVVADVHFGRTAASSVEADLGDEDDVLARLRDLLERTDPEVVVVAGDLLHSFSTVPRGVEESVSELCHAVEAADADLVCTPGNHDTMLEDVFDGEQVPAYRLGDGETVVCHGHEMPALEGGRYVVGHDHPALTIDGKKRPCFLYGPDVYEGSDVLVLPAFTRLARGMSINRMHGRDFQTPLVTDADGFHPGVWDEANDEVLWFPPLGECRRLL